MREGLGTALALALISSACRIDQLEPSASLAEASAELEVMQEPEAPSPVVLARVSLSEFAFDHFRAIEMTVKITSGQGLEARGIAPAWLGAEASESERADFGGQFANVLQAHPRLDVAPCSDRAACVVTLELTPRGEWASDVTFPLHYAIDATLQLEPRERMALRADLELSLEGLP